MNQEYKLWVELAKSDLETAKSVINNNKILPSVSIYHSHQCVEKIIKAILVKYNEQIPKIHNLNFLLKKATNYYPNLAKFDDYCAELNTFLPKLRYPIDEQITQIEAKACLKIAKEIYKTILSILEN